MRNSGRDVSREEFAFVLESEYVNCVQLQEHIMGSMKSLQPDKDMPFDVGGFVRSGRAEGKSEDQPKTNPASTDERDGMNRPVP